MKSLVNYLSENIFDVLIYIAVGLTVIGQIVIGWQYYIGQGAFLVGNILYLYRDVKLERPKADIIKDVVFTALTIALVIIYFLSK